MYSVKKFTVEGDTKMFKFNTLTAATNFVNRANKIWMIILGDDMLYWVVTPAKAAQLVKQGYELAD